MYSQIFPQIVYLPLGYSCKIIVNTQNIYKRLTSYSDAEVMFSIKCFRDGKLFKEENKNIIFSKSNLKSHPDLEFELEDQSDLGLKSPGFLELSINSKENLPIFSSRSLTGVSNYIIHYKNKKKSFLSDPAYKVGSPPVIQQFAIHKMYLDTYPIIDINVEKDLGESLAFINPYPKSILAKVATMDGREIKSIKVDALSCRQINLKDLLKNHSENEWRGHIQITANNRVIVYNLKHSFKDIQLISDVEHLDPYRGELNFLPLTQGIRIFLGNFLRSIK